MANSKTNKIIQHLRKAMLLRDGAAMTDGQLLDCFLRQRDDAAFTALVRRHAQMVWGVCRRVLPNHHDAEDAFQATFLVFVRKAASVEPREMVANWLYGVAHQTALKARSIAVRRKKRERQMVEMPEPAVEERDVGHDLKPLLDHELSCLPDKYRVPIVLCDLEGKTRKEAARQLGWPEGTVAGRLATARKMLARRLARRRVALSSGALAAVLSHNAASAWAPPSVISSTVQAATILAAGEAAASGLMSAKVATLVEGVMKTMWLTKLKSLVAVMIVLSFMATGAAVLTCCTAAEQESKPSPTGNPVNASPAPKNESKQAQGTPKEGMILVDVKGVLNHYTFRRVEGGNWKFSAGTVRAGGADLILDCGKSAAAQNELQKWHGINIFASSVRPLPRLHVKGRLEFRFEQTDSSSVSSAIARPVLVVESLVFETEGVQRKAASLPQSPQPAEKQRMLRWRIVFENKDGNEYAKQLEALGASVAIPTKERNQYQMVCDLSKRPVKTTLEDVSKINRLIYFMETETEALRLLSKEFGLKETPEHILVILPRFVEDELVRKELDFAHHPENDILETTFRFSQTKRGFDIKVKSQRTK